MKMKQCILPLCSIIIGFNTTLNSMMGMRPSGKWLGDVYIPENYYTQTPTAAPLSPADRDALTVFPRIIQDWCTENPYNTNTLKLKNVGHAIQNGEPVALLDIESYSRKICAKMRLSHQTTYAIMKACRAIATKQPFETLLLTKEYNRTEEKENQEAFMHQMPAILKKICLQYPDDFHVQKLTLYLFSTQKEVIALLDPKSELLTINDQNTHNTLMDWHIAHIVSRFYRYIYISPQTVAETAREYREQLFEQKPVSTVPYDCKKEMRNGRSILNRAPVYIWAHSDGLKNKAIQNLVAYAYLLEHPLEAPLMEYFLDYHYDMRLPKCLPGSNQMNSIYAHAIKQEIKKVLTDDRICPIRATCEFIDCFKSPEASRIKAPFLPLCLPVACQKINPAIAIIEGCYHTILSLCIETKDARTVVLAPLKECRMAMLTAAKAQPLLHWNTKTVIEKMKEALPSCPICLGFYEDQFKKEIGDRGGAPYQLPCSHTLCTQCLGRWQSTCPFCRKSIEL
jgi:hypothetical protein